MRLFNVGSEKLIKAGFAEQFLHGGDAEHLALIGVKACAFNSNGNKGIACGLNNLQLIRAGEPLGGKASAESDFATDDDDDFLA